MLTVEHRKKLIEIVVRGVLHSEQTDDLVYGTWRHQEGTCPKCGEEIPWHRGVLFQTDAHAAWMCMVCALLIGATSRKNNSHSSDRSLTTPIPVPPGFSLVWVNAMWLPRTKNDPPHTILGIARGLGCESSPAVRASIIEDPNVARITRPKEAGGDGGTWSPYLLRGRISRKDSELLLSYVGSEEEIMTSDFVHEQIGFDTATIENLEVDTINGPTRLPHVESQLLHQIPEMNSIERCQGVPRCGLAERDAWESMPRTGFDGLELAMKTAISDDLVLYLIPYHTCPHFYHLEGPQSWMQGPDGLIDKVGFHLGRFWDPWDTKSVPLWKRVFGDALVPGIPPDTANEIESESRELTDGG